MQTKCVVARGFTLLLALICLGVSQRTVAYAQTEPPPTSSSPPSSTFAGLSLGVGLSVTVDTGKNDRVQDAEVVNGIVRVKKKNKAVARVMLETHYFFTPCAGHLDESSKKCEKFLGLEQGQYGIGPFISLQPGTNEIIEAIGGGFMIGLRRTDSKLGSFNLGVGFVVDPNAKVLGSGIKEDKPLPANETQVRFTEKTQAGLLILASFSF